MLNEMIVRFSTSSYEFNPDTAFVGEYNAETFANLGLSQCAEGKSLVFSAAADDVSAASIYWMG